MIVEKCPEIILIFQKQNPLAWPEQMIPRNLGGGHCRRLIRVKIEGDSLFHGTVAEALPKETLFIARPPYAR